MRRVKFYSYYGGFESFQTPLYTFLRIYFYFLFLFIYFFPFYTFLRILSISQYPSYPPIDRSNAKNSQNVMRGPQFVKIHKNLKIQNRYNHIRFESAGKNTQLFLRFFNDSTTIPQFARYFLVHENVIKLSINYKHLYTYIIYN